jgi:segregation and condensation protein B
VEPDKLKQVVEAALLAADEPLSVDQLAKLFRPSEVDTDTIRADLREALKVLTEETEGRGYELAQVASGYRYQVRQDLSPWISRLWEEKPPRYTRALLETLALVAYKQPVTRGDIEQVRGVSVSQNIMRTLLERGWIRVVGQREVPGRPSMYGTTKEFLDYFNLKSLDQLPPLAEIRELIEPVIVEEADDESAEDIGPDDGGVSDATEPSETVAEGEEMELDADDAGADPFQAFEEEDDDEAVDLDSEDFDAEIAAAIAAADAASDRFNNPEGEPEEVDDNPGRPQVVDVVTDLETEDDAEAAEPAAAEDASAAADSDANAAEADDGADAEQPTAEVVQLPRAPH